MSSIGNHTSGTLHTNPSQIGSMIFKHSDNDEDNRQQQSENNSCFLIVIISRFFKRYGLATTWHTMLLIVIFGFGFNTPRWLEWNYILDNSSFVMYKNSFGIKSNDSRNNESSDTWYDWNETDRVLMWPNETEVNGINTTYFGTNETQMDLRTTLQLRLLKNPLYVLYYSLIVSGIVMLIIPVSIMIRVCCSFRTAIPPGAQRHKTLRIMSIIIGMFMICHIPKVNN